MIPPGNYTWKAANDFGRFLSFRTFETDLLRLVMKTIPKDREGDDGEKKEQEYPVRHFGFQGKTMENIARKTQISEHNNRTRRYGTDISPGKPILIPLSTNCTAIMTNKKPMALETTLSPVSLNSVSTAVAIRKVK